MVKFNEDHKEEMAQGNYFGQGVHKVKIATVEFCETENGKEYAEFTVTDDEGEKEGSTRVWFTTDGAIKYAFNTIRTIFVHNAPEDKKDEMRKSLASIKDTKELAKICEKLSGKECWYTVYENPERTYPGKDGKLRNSYDRNIYGYAPAPKEITVDKSDSATPDEGLDEPFPSGF